MAEPLVLINAFEVPREEAERFIAAWEKMRTWPPSLAMWTPRVTRPSRPARISSSLTSPDA
jgi:hypothetical protein